MNVSRFSLAAFALSITLAAGCELVAQVDRSQIPEPTGSGGAAGASGTGGGTAGGAPECTDASQCDMPASECATATCDGGKCGVKALAKGSKATQVAGNCQKEQCDGNGMVEGVDDDTDLPHDGQQCTDDVCMNGKPKNPNKPSGSACGSGGVLRCDGSGHCVACTQASDCGTDDDCKSFTCDSGVCNEHDQAAGHVTTNQTDGDCQVEQCDGNGNAVNVDDNGDLPVDNKECTDDLCAAGTPSNPPLSSGTQCGGTGSTKQCDGNGSCVECLAPSDCPGTSDACKTVACTAGVCGFDFQPDNTPAGVQTSGDCKKSVCDGNGNTVTRNDDQDPPNDNNPCTTDLCSNGTGSHGNEPSGTTCGNGLTCDGSGSCNGCTQASDCPGTNDECKTKTCTTGVCGFTFASAGTVLTTGQTAGDCQELQCDGNGNSQSVAKNSDVPADDANACTDETCVAGSPQHPPKNAGQTCSVGGTVCDGAGHCVACNVGTDCSGTDTDCAQRTCTTHTCGTTNKPAGTVTLSQTDHDCKQNQCDGNGNIISVADNSDLPVPDANQCTDDVCVAGAPQHPNKSDGTTCDDGSLCTQSDSCQAGTCTGSNPVVCGAADQCHQGGVCQPATGTCTFAPKNDGTVCNDGDACTNGDTCQAGACQGGTPTTCTPLDSCHVAGVCNPANGTCSNPAATDGTSCSDGNACTTGDTCQSGACTSGSPVVCPPPADVCHLQGSCTPGTGVCSTPPAPLGTSCSDGDACTTGDACDGAGTCAAGTPVTCTPLDQCHVAGVCAGGTCSNPNATDGTTCTGGVCEGGICEPTPSVTGTTPSGTGVAFTTSISVTFSTAMNASTLTTKSTLDSGACTGSIQLSTDGFTTCIPMTAPSLVGNTATMTPTIGLAYGSVYQIRVTTAAQSAFGIPLASNFTATGFTTGLSGTPLDGKIVLSQIYGGGGNAGCTYNNDFIEIHNRGESTVSLAGWSVQYASIGGTTWSVTNLQGSIAPGAYYLVQEQSGGTTNCNTPLPTPDATGNINMSAGTSSGAGGKIALVSSTTALSGACPGSGAIVDMIGYRHTTAADCFEGASMNSAGITNNGSLVRAAAGCTDANTNSTDFAVQAAAAPRNSASPIADCGGVPTTLNETNLPAETDFCNVQFPTSLSVQTGINTGDVFCQVFESGVTPSAGALTVQVGYGPPTANPENQAGWTWFPTTFNVNVGNNDEYKGNFTAPAPGDYRYACRVVTGSSFTYCDVGGAGSNVPLTFDLPEMPILTVTP